MKVAMLLSCSSFEAFFGRVLKQTRESYLESYRNDWHWYYAKGLQENGLVPIIYIPSLHEGGLYETPEGISVRFLPLAKWYWLLDQKLPKQLGRQTRFTGYADERINAHAFMDSLSQALEADKIDLLYIQEYWSGRFDHIVHRIGIPVAGANHGGVAERAYLGFKSAALRRAKVCYGQTQAECRLIETFGGHAELQPNGCDLATFYPDPGAEREKTILTVARLTNKQKRTSDLIHALTRLPEDWTLDIVGTGPDRDMLEALAHKNGVAARIRFRGFVGRNDVRGFLQTCGVFAMPSDNEAVAIAALEAMACGAPVVLSRIPTFEELVTDGVNGCLAPVGDVDALAAAITNAWTSGPRLGSAAEATIRSQYDSRALYRRLADSLRASATA
ncbi:MAG: glycosyltransferase family 1 protein [Hyphomicrobiales bacterium]|nr:glycosyltransferase family 1 protein [Hyphomicrobiales bacterium]